MERVAAGRNEMCSGDPVLVRNRRSTHVARMFAEPCLLFFPGSRPELLPKALASGAGRVCMDLEDAVAPGAKDAARAAAIERLASPDFDHRRVALRINAPVTPEGALDLDAIASALSAHPPVRPGFTIVVPKVTGPEDVHAVLDAVRGAGLPVEVVPVIETARGLSRVEEIAAAGAISALFFGGLDLSVELGCALDWETLLYARSRTVLAGRLAGVALIDTPFFDLEDRDGLVAESVRSRRLGFTAKAAIHPGQVDVINGTFRPSPADIERARGVLEAAEREATGAFMFEGVMIDRPAVEAARRLLAVADHEE